MYVFDISGHATVGIKEHESILQEVREFNGEIVPIFCLSFGRFADFTLMKTLSLQNHAFTRKIYIAADAAIQLEGFYKEVCILCTNFFGYRHRKPNLDFYKNLYFW